jgi:hypothetical protein
MSDTGTRIGYPDRFYCKENKENGSEEIGHVATRTEHLE